MSEITIPDGLKLSPQEWRVFAALQAWADSKAVAEAINEPDGRKRLTPPGVVVSKIKCKIEPFGLTIESRGWGTPGKAQRSWRIVKGHARIKAVAA